MGRAYQNRKESMAKTSDQKARVYSRHARVIYVTAKQGGLDPDGNLALRSAIDRAKKDQVPGHVIDKAIDNYLELIRIEKKPHQFIKMGSTFFNNCVLVIHKRVEALAAQSFRVDELIR